MIKEINQNWLFKQTGKENWLHASVPGCVHTDLLNNNLIDDPFYRINEKSLQWIDKEDWEYKTIFTVDKDFLHNNEHAELLFKGLDSYSDVYLNDKLILSTNNAYREWRVDCKPLLKEGDNNLYIKFFSPIRIGLDKRTEHKVFLPAINDNSELGGLEDKKVSVFTRKPPYHYGWDWGPRFVTSGISKPVLLQSWNHFIIRNFSISNHSQMKHDSKSANLSATFEIESSSNEEITLTVNVDGSLLAKQSYHLSKGLQTIHVDFSIENPKLWWCNGLGDPNLYSIKGEIEGNKTKDSASTLYGIRTVKLIRNPDQYGQTFFFELNGVPVFAKGANYIPLDMFLNRVSNAKYEKIIKAAADANMNMLRVWGGGIYETDSFYDLCDKYGIMIWQDFMFACSLYPGEKEFTENVKQEAIDNVKRLRNHPCIALWCGNNEIYTAWHNWGYKNNFEKQDFKTAQTIWNDYNYIFHDILPKVIRKYSKETDYWPSSPMASWNGEKYIDYQKGINYIATDDIKSGDKHYWGVWHSEEPFSKYNEIIPRFMSEYGFQSFPDFETVKSFTTEEDRDIESEVMNAHQRHPRGNSLIKKYMARDYNVPKDFREFLYMSQILQAEGIKTGIEAHRRNMPYCMGSLYWQLNDCWPVASWSSMDYFLRWKALHFFAKKAFNPILISTTVESNSLKVYIISDQLTPFKGKLSLKIMNFEGDLLFNKDCFVDINAFSSRVYYECNLNELLSGLNKKNLVFITELSENENKPISECLFYFDSPKNLALTKPNIKTSVMKTENGFLIDLNTDSLAKNVYLSVEEVNGSFSDNFFDMLPNSNRRIIFSTPLNLNSKDIEKKLKIMTL